MGMANLIDRDSLMAQLEDRQAFLVKEWGYRDHYTRGFEEAVDKVGNAPVVDAVEVVRCEVCKHHDHFEVETFLRYVDRIENPYCAAGERKDND